MKRRPRRAKQTSSLEGMLFTPVESVPPTIVEETDFDVAVFEERLLAPTPVYPAAHYPTKTQEISLCRKLRRAKRRLFLEAVKQTEKDPVVEFQATAKNFTHLKLDDVKLEPLDKETLLTSSWTTPKLEPLDKESFTLLKLDEVKLEPLDKENFTHLKLNEVKLGDVKLGASGQGILYALSRPSCLIDTHYISVCTLLIAILQPKLGPSKDLYRYMKN